jgi:zinc transport system substrate-binding protein
VAGDPHVWLDPVRYAAIATRIGRALGQERLARLLATRLRALDRAFAAGLGRCARHEIVTSHAAFGYLAERYGLRQVALTGLAPEADPGPRGLERLVARVRRTGATVVFVEPLVPPALAETVAREAHVTTATLDPIEGIGAEAAAAGADYFSIMRANLAALRKALGCR